MGFKPISAVCKTLPPDHVFATTERRFWPQITGEDAAPFSEINDLAQYTCDGQEIHKTTAYYPDESRVALDPDVAQAFIKNLESGVLPQRQPLFSEGQTVISRTMTQVALMAPITLSPDDHTAIPILIHTVAQIQMGSLLRQREAHQWGLLFKNHQDIGGSFQIDGNIWKSGDSSKLFSIRGETEPYIILGFYYNAGLQHDGSFVPRNVEVTLTRASDAKRLNDIRKKIKSEEQSLEFSKSVFFQEQHLATLSALKKELDDAQDMANEHQVTISAGKLLRMQDPNSSHDTPQCPYRLNVCLG